MNCGHHWNCIIEIRNTFRVDCATAVKCGEAREVCGVCLCVLNVVGLM